MLKPELSIVNVNAMSNLRYNAQMKPMLRDKKRMLSDAFSKSCTLCISNNSKPEYMSSITMTCYSSVKSACWARKSLRRANRQLNCVYIYF